MPDQEDNISVSTGSDADYLDITVDEMEELWNEYLQADNDRQPGEFTKQEAAALWGLQIDTAYDRLQKLIRIGKLSKRKGRENGYGTTFYKKV